jgi:acetyl-CoA/propionyl-CoA carboxylase biotin carboxyl carrier protein
VTVIGPAFGGGMVMNGSAPAAGAAPRKPRQRQKGGSAVGGDTLPSPLQGNMWRVKVRQGDTVEEGQLLCIIEAMKMENEITAHKAGVVAELPITEGAAIAAGDPIATIRSAAE